MLAGRKGLPRGTKKETEEHIDKYYQNLETIMRVNNVGFFDPKMMPPVTPDEGRDEPDEAYSQHLPTVNETNYNAQLKYQVWRRMIIFYIAKFREA